jgi:methylphosphotriester-DNA--protein-cysteine methyltransferase
MDNYFCYLEQYLGRRFRPSARCEPGKTHNHAEYTVEKALAALNHSNVVRVGAGAKKGPGN